MSARVRAAPALACLMALAGCVVGKGPEHDCQPAGVSVFVDWSAAEATASSMTRASSPGWSG